jgi:hypothetical protein
MNRRKVIMPNRITQDELSKAAETLGAATEKLKQLLEDLGHEVIPPTPPEPEVDYVVIDQDGFTYAKEDVVGRGGWELFWKRFGPFRVYVLQQPEA